MLCCYSHQGLPLSHASLEVPPVGAFHGLSSHGLDAGCTVPSCPARLLGALYWPGLAWPCLLWFQSTLLPRLSERLEGGTSGTFPTPGVTHRKLSVSQPMAQGLKGAKFSVGLCGERAGAAGLPVGESAAPGGADSSWACQPVAACSTQGVAGPGEWERAVCLAHGHHLALS